MEKITEKLDFIGFKTSIAISSYYAIFIILSYFLGQNYLPEVTKNSGIFNFYTHLDSSFGGYIISFIWAFFDSLTLMGVVMLLNKIIKIAVK